MTTARFESPVLELKETVFKCTVKDSSSHTYPWNIAFHRGEGVALLSSNRRIRSQLHGWLYGMVKPISGDIISRGSVSWPLGVKGGMDSKLTLKQNMEFLVGIYPDRLAPLDWDRFLSAFLQVLNLSSDQPLKTLRSKDQKMFFMVASLAFSFR